MTIFSRRDCYHFARRLLSVRNAMTVFSRREKGATGMPSSFFGLKRPSFPVGDRIKRTFPPRREGSAMPSATLFHPAAKGLKIQKKQDDGRIFRAEVWPCAR
jgi:hypothetical protein